MALFVLVLFGTVFLSVYFASRALIRLLRVNHNIGAVAITAVVVMLTTLEPIGVFYFALYAASRALGVLEGHHSALVLVSVITVYWMIRPHFAAIVRKQYADALEEAPTEIVPAPPVSKKKAKRDSRRRGSKKQPGGRKM